MFSALLKAFTGRAGLLASVLVLALIALTAAAVYFNMPRIEQKLADSSLPVLQSQLEDEDKVTSFRAAGRDLLLVGQFKDPQGLASSLGRIEGVHSVIVNGVDLSQGAAQQQTPEAGQAVDAEPEAVGLEDVAASAAVTGEQPPAESAVAESIEKQATADQQEQDSVAEVSQTEENEPVSGEPLAPVGVLSGEVEQSALEQDADTIEESSLSLRYDGRRLNLSGHMGDEQMAQLVIDSVRRAIPPYSEMNADVDGAGKVSPLNWMNAFLAAVSRLPDDAQGVIEGSDSKGVEIIPDAQQTLREEAPEAPLTQAPAAAPEAIVTEPAESNGSEDTTAITDLAIAEPLSDQDEAPAPDETPVVQSSEETQEITVADQGAEQSGPDTAISEGSEHAGASHPGQYIVALNKRIAALEMFEPGQYAVGDMLGAELDKLAEMLRQNPELLLRVVGNIDFSADPRVAEYVGVDRAREVRDYLYKQGIDRFRVFAMPLPRDYAYDKQVQVVFYISE